MERARMLFSFQRQSFGSPDGVTNVLPWLVRCAVGAGLVLMGWAWVGTGVGVGAGGR